MFKHYLFIAVLWVFSIALIATGFLLAGTPVSQKSVQLDQTRMSDFSSIRYEIENYFSKEKMLPTSLTQLKENNPNITIQDPETKKEYELKPAPPASYQLCTTFALDAKDNPNRAYDISLTYKKGYSCVTYKIPDYLMVTPIPSQAVIQTQPVCQPWEVRGKIIGKLNTGYTIQGDKGEAANVPLPADKGDTIPTDLNYGDRVKATQNADCTFVLSKE